MCRCRWRRAIRIGLCALVGEGSRSYETWYAPFRSVRIEGAVVVNTAPCARRNLPRRLPSGLWAGRPCAELVCRQMVEGTAPPVHLLSVSLQTLGVSPPPRSYPPVDAAVWSQQWNWTPADHPARPPISFACGSWGLHPRRLPPGRKLQPSWRRRQTTPSRLLLHHRRLLPPQRGRELGCRRNRESTRGTGCVGGGQSVLQPAD